MAFGPATLPGKGPHLAMHLVHQVVEPRKVDRGFLETALSTAATVPIEADTGCFLEQLASLVRTVGEQGVDHLRFDHDAGVGTESRTAHQILDVAEPADGAVEQVIALSRARKPSRDDHLAIGNWQLPIRVVENQRHLGDVDGPPRGRALEDYLLHLGAAEKARALLPEHPAHRIRDVGFAASVRSDDRRHPGFESHVGPVGERFEPVHFQSGQPH